MPRTTPRSPPPSFEPALQLPPLTHHDHSFPFLCFSHGFVCGQESGVYPQPRACGVHFAYVEGQRYSLISSSLTAEGVRRPLSVKRSVMYVGGV